MRIVGDAQYLKRTVTAWENACRWAKTSETASDRGAWRIQRNIYANEIAAFVAKGITKP